MAINYAVGEKSNDAVLYAGGPDDDFAEYAELDYMVYHDGKIYGIYEAGLSYYIRVYDFATGIITQSPSASPDDGPIRHLTYYNGFLYTIWDNPNNSYAYKIIKYEIATETWFTVLDESNSQGPILYNNGFLYYWYDYQHYRKLDLSAETRVYTLTLPQKAYASVIFNGIIYHTQVGSMALLRYDTTTDALIGETMPNPYTTRTIYAMQAITNMILVWYQPDGSFDDWILYKYDIVEDAWYELNSSVPDYCRPQTSTIDGDVIYVRELTNISRIDIVETPDTITWRRQ